MAILDIKIMKIKIVELVLKTRFHRQGKGRAAVLVNNPYTVPEVVRGRRRTYSCAQEFSKGPREAQP